MILIDEHSVVCSPEVFKSALHHYDLSLPTGTTIGRRWWRSWPFGAPLDQQEHQMGEFVSHPDPKLVGIKWRSVYLVENQRDTAFYRHMGPLRDLYYKCTDPFYDSLERPGVSPETLERAKEYHYELMRR